MQYTHVKVDWKAPSYDLHHGIILMPFSSGVTLHLWAPGKQYEKAPFHSHI